MKAPENLSAREMRRRQRQISAYLSELRVANTDTGEAPPRRPRVLGTARSKARAARARRAARPA
jgi:hypothetical protein